MLLRDFIKSKGMTEDSLYAKTKEGRQMTRDADYKGVTIFEEENHRGEKVYSGVGHINGKYWQTHTAMPLDELKRRIDEATSTKDLDLGKMLTNAVNFIYGEDRDQAEDVYTKNRDAAGFRNGEMVEFDYQGKRIKGRIIDVDNMGPTDAVSILWVVDTNNPDQDYAVYADKNTRKVTSVRMTRTTH